MSFWFWPCIVVRTLAADVFSRFVLSGDATIITI